MINAAAPLLALLSMLWAAPHTTAHKTKPHKQQKQHSQRDAPQKELLAELERIDQALVDAEGRLRDAEQQARAINDKRQTTAVQLDTAQKNHQTTQRRFGKRLRALTRMRHGVSMLVISDVRSLPDYVATSRMLRWLTEHDKQQQAQYRREADALVTLQAELTHESDALAALTEQIKIERDRLVQQKAERRTWLTRVNAQRPLAKQAADERQRAKTSLHTFVQQLTPATNTAQNFADQKGKLPRPAAGAVGVKFGQSVAGHGGTPMAHSGWDIKAERDSPVYAVAAGKVVYADWLRGYGQIVIIDHSDKYHTLMAHLGTIAVRVGNHVAAGQQVGTVGETGSLRGPVLYFEIRHKGMAVDPAHWLRR